MLSRVADSLYWMSRYFERADHCARVLEANYNLMLNPSNHFDGAEMAKNSCLPRVSTQPGRYRSRRRRWFA